MKTTRIVLGIFMAAMLLYSCEKNENAFKDVKVQKQEAIFKTTADGATIWPGEEGCAIRSFDLIAGQNIYVGKVTALTYAGSLYLRYDVNEGCNLTETHVFVGDAANDLPVGGNGNPKIGHFPVSWEGSATTVTHEISLADLGDCFDIAAHAVVICPEGEETAWAKNGEQIFAVKSLMDPTYAITAYEESVSWTDWCNIFRTYTISEALEGPIPLTRYTDGTIRFGEVVVEKVDDVLRFKITSDNGDVEKTYLFIGTQEELDAIGICNYTNFPYVESVVAAEHVFEIPVADTDATEFGGSRWGWYVNYCAGGC